MTNSVARNRDIVQDFHDANNVIRKLGDVITHARFTHNRGGIVPHTELHSVLKEFEDATATLKHLLAR